MKCQKSAPGGARSSSKGATSCGSQKCAKSITTPNLLSASGRKARKQGQGTKPGNKAREQSQEIRPGNKCREPCQWLPDGAKDVLTSRRARASRYALSTGILFHMAL